MHTFSHSLTYSMLLLVALPVSYLPTSLQAQTIPEITPDRYGNYYSNESNVQSNESNVQAKVTNSQLAAGSLWRVAADALNCRRSASITSNIVRTYLIGELLEVEVYRGGSDEVLINPLDKNGKPWMPVRGKNIEDICYVRANSRYIQPFTPR